MSSDDQYKSLSMKDFREETVESSVPEVRNRSISDSGTPWTPSRDFDYRNTGLASCSRVVCVDEMLGLGGDGRFGGSQGLLTPSYHFCTPPVRNSPYSNSHRSVNSDLTMASPLFASPRLRSSYESTPHQVVAEVFRPRKLPTYSAGSESHYHGTCSPCAFYYSEKGCTNTSECPFCHLCPQGEFKRKKKIKFFAMRAEKRERKIAEQQLIGSIEKAVFDVMNSSQCNSVDSEDDADDAINDVEEEETVTSPVKIVLSDENAPKDEIRGDRDSRRARALSSLSALQLSYGLRESNATPIPGFAEAPTRISLDHELRTSYNRRRHKQRARVVLNNV
eukprot:GEMP01035132.1.p1 GENE.GEMP01035132.1~~GEMP01035132.1.p1  ORF type:complete len:335 (+),score=43.20 GEMP01035132.1:183-1187(+)